jgi:hypothetical protein
MTTLRRLIVAVYPIGLFLLAMIVWGESAEIRAQSPIRVGYYDMTNGNGAGSSEQVAPILAAGFTPVLLTDVTSPELAGLHILFVQNPSPNLYNPEYLASRAAIDAAVRAGMVLVIHDRTVSNMMTGARVGDILPGVTVPQSVSAMKTTMPSTFNNIEVTDAASLIVNGPFGTISSSGATSLDGGGQSNHGTVNLLMSPNIPSPKKGLLHTGMSGMTQSVTFTYALGAGHVIYSTIPIDMFLKGGGNNPPRDNISNIYAPNLLTYAACGLRAFPATLSADSATGHYGGTARLSATVKCGMLPLPDVTVEFSLNGVPVGSAQTNASGIAALDNASLGSSADLAIPVGSYPTGVRAAFNGTALAAASSASAALTVEKAPATITYAGGEFVYDATPRPSTGSVTGVFGEALGTPTFTYTDANSVVRDTPPVDAGVFVITAASAETDTYLATTASSSATTIRIAPAPLTVTADEKTKTYGAAVPALTARFEGFVPGEDAGALSGTLKLTTAATASSPVGEYAIAPSGLASGNYAITFVAGKLAVTPAALTVRADDSTKIYGGDLPSFTARFDGFVLGENPDVLQGRLRFTTDATRRSVVGGYSIKVSGASSANYSISFVDGTLTVTPAALTIRADDKERLVGKMNPPLTVTYEGFVLDETDAVLDTRPSVTTPAVLTSPDGDYPIVVSGASDANYSIEDLDGLLTVSPEGRIHGAGFVDAGGARHHFEFDARETIVLGERGSLSLRIQRDGESDVFVSHLITSVMFKNHPGVTPGGKAAADALTFTGIGTWNGASATFEVTATDKGEPAGNDTIHIKIRVAGRVVNTTNGTLNGGNVQSNRIK